MACEKLYCFVTYYPHSLPARGPLPGHEVEVPDMAFSLFFGVGYRTWGLAHAPSTLSYSPELRYHHFDFIDSVKEPGKVNKCAPYTTKIDEPGTTKP